MADAEIVREWLGKDEAQNALEAASRIRDLVRKAISSEEPLPR